MNTTNEKPSSSFSSRPPIPPPVSSSSSSTEPVSSVPETRIVDTPIKNKNEAFQLLVTFLNLAYTRGAFQMEESSKIWECISFFKD
jgi:hypothetical protein